MRTHSRGFLVTAGTDVLPELLAAAKHMPQNNTGNSDDIKAINKNQYIHHICNTHARTYAHTTSWILSGTTWVRWHQKGKTNRNLLQQEIVNSSGISWAMAQIQICT